MIHYNVRKRAEDAGIANATQLATFAQLTAPVASRVWASKPLKRIEVATLESLTKAFGLKSPWLLLEWRKK